MKVFLLGLDGMTLRIVEPYIKAGLLPNFQKVIDNGSCGILRSTIPPTTPPGWTSLSTGKNPGKHGIFEFRRKIGYKTELITKNISPHAEPIWNILSRNGKKVAVINMPFTYPPDKVKGIMISGLMTPNVNKDFVFPEEARKDLFSLVPDYQLDVDDKEFMFSGDKDKLFDGVFKITEHCRKLMLHFLEKYSWDLFFITFLGPDRLQHFMWDDILSMEPKCVDYYKLLDDILGELLEKMDSQTVLCVASDHGFRATKKIFYINNFFKEIGSLQTRDKQSIKKRLFKLNISGVNIDGILNRVKLIQFKKYIPVFLKHYARKFFVTPHGLGESEVEWEKTKVFGLLGTTVFINLKGREPKGIVERADYQNLCEVIINELLKVEDPETGERIIKSVYKGDDIYSCETDEERPDLVVVPNEGYSIMEGLADKVLCDTRLGNIYGKADHEIEGLFMSYGEAINNKRLDADIYDIMPTILYLMGVAIPEDVDGRVLTEIINRDFVEKNEIRFETAKERVASEKKVLDKEEQKAVEQHLKNLGYLS